MGAWAGVLVDHLLMSVRKYMKVITDHNSTPDYQRPTLSTIHSVRMEVL